MKWKGTGKEEGNKSNGMSRNINGQSDEKGASPVARRTDMFWPTVLFFSLSDSELVKAWEIKAWPGACTWHSLGHQSSGLS